MAKKTLNFRSREAYSKWLAFKHIHLPRTKEKDRVTIAGKPHKVKHGR